MNQTLCRSAAGLLACGMLAGLVPARASEPVSAPYAGAVSEVPSAQTVTWEELPQRIREGNPLSQALGEGIRGLDSIDYELMRKKLVDQLNELAEWQWGASLMKDNYTTSILGQQYDLVRDVFDDLKAGELQQDHADAIRQQENGRDQLVAGGQTLYITLLTLEQSLLDADRGLATLDRSLTELRLRRQLGQVSDQQVQQLEQTRTDTLSKISTLKNTISVYKAQLQSLMGETPTGELTLGPLPEVTQEDLEHISYDEDLAAAKEASWTLYSAKLTLDDAEEQWKEDKKDLRNSSYQYEYTIAESTWNAAQFTYQSEVLSFETSFHALYQTLMDKRQALDSKTSDLAYHQKLLEAARLRYERGSASYFSVLAAQDDLETARSALETAQIELFAAYHNYQTAVAYGILS